MTTEIGSERNNVNLPPPSQSLLNMPQRPGSVEVGESAPKGETRPRRWVNSADKLVTQPVAGVETVPDVLSYAARTHGNKKAAGYRDIIRIVEEEQEIKKVIDGKETTQKKTWKFFELSDYKYFTYLEVQERAKAIGAGFVKLGINKGDMFNIYAGTCLNWQLVQHGLMMVGTTIATAYDTLGESGLSHSLSEPECVGVFTHDELLPTLVKVLPNTPTVKHIVYDGKPPQDLLDQIKAVREDITLIHLDELRQQGSEYIESVNFEERAPKKDDVACIMYTSGSTGAPKGVILAHSNLIASVGAVWGLVGHLMSDDDSVLAYLPLAHILEYIVELTFFWAGITLGFGKVRTLTDTSVRNCLGDIRAFRPSIMVGVPAVWETIRKGIIGKVEKMGTVKKSVFNGALTLKKNVPALGPIVDSAVLSAVKAQTGGRLRYTLSGGAALSKETQEFLTLALVTVLQGYGMTESCGMSAILPPEHFSYGPVGVPVPSMEIKLIDAPEANYLTTNDPQQGEILIRGPSLCKGYFKRDDLNNDENIFTKDGWMRTGDIGQWNKDGTLSVIDRIKNLVKLSGGEYIALERLESTYKSCNLVANICVHAHTDAKQPMGIIIPHEANLRHALKSSNPSLADSSLHDLCHDKSVAALVLKECNNVAKKSQFKPLEMLEAVVLSDEEWTPENGLVTAAQKIQRKKIAEHFKDEIKAVYPY